MSSAGPFSRRRLAGLLAISAIVAVGAAVRLWDLKAGVPHAVDIGEPQVVDRAIRILRTGDWNPHIFDDPTLVIYLQALVAIARFLWGAVKGEWISLDGFSVEAIYTTGRFVAAFIGAAAVWITYRLGTELASRRVALIAAAQMAVQPGHVRESHFILTDVPMTTLATLAVWLSVRAARVRTVRAYAWAGAACGLAAAAKYNGGVVLSALAAAWLLNDRSSPDRAKKALAACGAALLAYSIGSPYTWLDMPAFLDGFAAQFTRLAGSPPAGDPAGLLYVKHLSQAGGVAWLPLAAAGMALLLWRPGARVRWAPPIVFAVTYFYMLSTHAHVFARYALPLIPMLSLFAAVAVVELVNQARRVPALARPSAQRILLAVIVLALLYPPAASTIGWLKLQRRPDTRAIAAEWLKTSAPRGARLAVDNSGPTYLGAAGFQVTDVELLREHDIAWYRSRVDYLLISATDLTQYEDYLNAGPVVFQINPTPQRRGPPIQIVQLVNR
ncbi:MAG TPA: glycosyltransferase family 39 protein [Vicinamibacterales bacterium]|jgi:4-amino-4-deoxy-L-arabinose transferase-like glycosyltransferase|nr:glycosyltransferase family 39 protein [Vicinamibacterales bacterium]